MAKKKTPVVLETTPDETIIEMPQVEDVAEVTTPEPEATYESGATYHASFTTTWRPEIDCGDHGDVETAKEAVEKAAVDLGADNLILAWRRESPLVWLATGHDGQVDTNLTIAKIVQV